MKGRHNFEDDLRLCLSRALEDSGLADYQDLISIEIPKETKFGDISTSLALRLSKPARQNPSQIAQSLVNSLKVQVSRSPISEDISEIKIEGGFINFFLSRSYFYKQLGGILSSSRDFGRQDLGQNKKALIEFVSANPTGPLSVAHARQAAVGDALANVLSFLGFDVKREYYLNDEGNQVNILGKSIELRLKELSGEKIDFPENYYQGDYIYDLAREAENKKIKSQDLSEFGVKLILDVIKKELDDFGVEFDSWYSQKALRESGKISEALDFLNEYLYRQEGATWFKSTRFADDKDRVVIKSDGSYTYLAPDIAYHRDKYRRGFTWLINLWGPDHHGYINRLKAAVAALGKDPASLSVIIVQLASIFREGKPVEMSTRRGQYITLREVLDEVGRDAARFFFLMRRTDSHLDFDLELAKKETSENPVYYVQYAHARICGILENVKAADYGKAGFDLLKQEEEMTLLKRLSQFPHILNVILSTLDPYGLTVYLQNVAADFHRFYDRHRVLGEDKELSLARQALIEGTRVILAKSFELLGVSAPRKM
jgi:arginyl-tRNA synthetase